MSRIARLGCVPLVLGLAVSGCDIGVDFWQNASVQVDVPAKVPKTFSTTQDLNLGGSSARLPVGNLDSVQIPEITIDISDVGSGNLATLISGSLVITDPADSTFTPVTLPFDNVAVVDDGQATIVPSAA